MLAQSYHKTNLFRRHIIKTELAPKYRDICANVHPYCTELFGDISKIVTDLESQSKLTNKMAPKKTFFRKSTQPQTSKYTSQRSEYHRAKPYEPNDYYSGYYYKSKNERGRGRSRPNRRSRRGKQ